MTIEVKDNFITLHATYIDLIRVIFPYSPVITLKFSKILNG